jgi:hypothetical protein
MSELDVKINLYEGVHCSFPDGCYIKLNPLSNSNLVQFENNNYYFLVSGDATLTYSSNNNPHLISSPYVGGGGWFDYVNQWQLNDDVSILTNTSTYFARVRLEPSSQALNVRLGIADNQTISTAAVAGSLLVVYGNDFTYNGTNINSSNPKQFLHRFNIETDQNISITSTTKCICFLIKEV